LLSVVAVQAYEEHDNRGLFAIIEAKL
jgi:hypothetical protein